MSEIKLDAAQWEGVVSATQQALEQVDSGDKTTLDRTTVERLKKLPRMQEDVGAAIGKYVRAAGKDVQKMKEAARHISEDDRKMAREFDGNGRNMVRFE